ncbi:transposase [Streptomyces albireticuli]|uniref:Transposase n=1 Tax=Streptomyces albireticuli TaxID=1940 RepID=A0A1Z2KUG8_9ACTN|nr:transposase [Streptomyces albireticuli]
MLGLRAGPAAGDRYGEVAVRCGAAVRTDAVVRGCCRPWPRSRPDHLGGDKACSSRRNRRYLRRRQIKPTIPERKDQRAHRRRRGSAGGRPTGFDKTIYKRRNEVERTINILKGFRAVATRFDKRAYIFHGTVTVAALRLWLRS